MSSGTRLAVTALLLVAIAAMGLAVKEYVLVAPLFLAALATWRLRLDGDIPFRTYVFMGVPFGLLARIHPVEGTSELGLNIFFYIALYMQLIAIRKLATSAPNVPQIIFCAASGVATIGADTDASLYHGVTLAAGVPLVLSMRGAIGARQPDDPKKRRPLGRGAGLLLALLLVVGFEEGGGLIVRHYYEDVSQAFIRRVAKMPLPSAGGFSGAARLGNVTGLQEGDAASAVALRAFAKRAPGYLRGKSFQDYEKGEWTPEPDGPSPRPEPLEQGSNKGRIVLEKRRPPAPDEEPAMRIFPSSTFGRYFFLPLQTTAVDTVSESVKIAPGGSLESPFDSTSAGYSVFTSRDPVRGEGWTALPKDPAVLAAVDRSLAEVVSSAHAGTQVQAIRDWFARKYTYRFGIEFEKGSDPLVQFLTVKTHGHCELFASAGALMLRRRGVPARYTTGYLCEEKNASSDDLWVARNRHAHAWVEYLDPKTGWEIAEFTPDTGMPTFKPATGFEAWLDALHGAWDRVAAVFAEHGAAGVAQLALRAVGAWLTGSWPGRAVLAALALYVLRRGALRLPKRAPRAVRRELSPALEAARERYLAHERALARRGLARAEHETLEEFAARLAPADAAPVREFAAIRYAPSP